MAAPKPITKCEVPVSPQRPEVYISSCGDDICMSVADAVALATYLEESQYVEDALDGCSLIERVTQ